MTPTKADLEAARQVRKWYGVKLNVLGGVAL